MIRLPSQTFEPATYLVPERHDLAGVARSTRWKRRLVGPLCGLLAASLIGINGLVAIGPVQTTDQAPTPAVAPADSTTDPVDR